MEAKFFNAKTGRLNRFINLPTSVVIPPKINILSNNNRQRSSELTIINPCTLTSNGNYLFSVEPGIGANTINTITLTEYILKS